MGGHDAGEIASTWSPTRFAAFRKSATLTRSPRLAVEALRQVNAELIQLARSGDGGRRSERPWSDSRSPDGSYRCFWMGDSRAYLLRGGEIVRLSHDHSLVQNLVDAGMIKPEEAETHANANLITRAVGVAETVEVDVVDGEARSGDLFLLASDGLTRVVARRRACRRSGRQGDRRGRRCAHRQGARPRRPDNVSLILVRAG